MMDHKQAKKMKRTHSIFWNHAINYPCQRDIGSITERSWNVFITTNFYDFIWLAESKIRYCNGRQMKILKVELQTTRRDGFIVIVHKGRSSAASAGDQVTNKLLFIPIIREAKCRFFALTTTIFSNITKIDGNTKIYAMMSTVILSLMKLPHPCDSWHLNLTKQPTKWSSRVASVIYSKNAFILHVYLILQQ